jgi:hypothetical protein
MFLEIRRYEAQPGQRDTWVTYFEEKVAPYQSSKGMKILGSFIDEESDTGFVWIRQFDDETQREALYAATYEADEWINVIQPPIASMLDRTKMVITRAAPTDTSPLR